ncbi:response regulator [Bacillus sp. 1P06AnD]|uniref:response regulator transcription factor n=1 Tax=Bacillus sp. 1P06AnD TaxID=3132208 RepID=UPI00399F665F
MYNLIIADDEEEIRNGLSNYIPWDQMGFHVAFQAKSGQDALDFANTHPVDVILSDIRMPIMTGIDLARELFLQSSTKKLILLSGYKEFEYAQQAIKYGVKNYLLKPTNYVEIFETFTAIKEELDMENSKEDEIEREEPIFDGKIITAIQQYVIDHYRTASLEGASAIVHMNASYISKYFKDKTGENFSDFATRIKMKKAAELLGDYTYKIYEISELVGYSNSKNFTRSFKQFHGKSPREFRNER